MRPASLPGVPIGGTSADRFPDRGTARVTVPPLRSLPRLLPGSNLPLPTFRGYLGHAQVSTTMRYVHHRPHSDEGCALNEGISVHGGDTSPEEAPTGIEPVCTA